ncbi:MAG: carbon-nitrogen hydrolase family protein, partial [Flavobacteriaceae bacterium]|nr:carbon-nitrogen hydrolase family protein [Flavobacteriaceae bacterium]
MSNTLKVGLAQIAPLWLDKVSTISKVIKYISDAGERGCELVVFGEALVPGYPFWLALTGGAEWNTDLNKELHAHYMQNAVTIENGDLEQICKTAASYSISVYLGIIERPLDRGGHSIYASLVYIDSKGEIKSVHRKLQPTYDERLTWSPGDGHGLK